MSGQVYVANSIIEGNVDFIWGNGAVYFDHSRDQGRRAQGLQRPGAQRDRRDGLRVRRLQPDRGARASRGTCWRAPTRTACRRLRWSRTSTARWGRTSIRVGWLIDGYARPAADAGAAHRRTAARPGTSPTCASGSTTASIRRARPSTSAGASRSRSSSPTPRPRSFATPPSSSAAGIRRPAQRTTAACRPMPAGRPTPAWRPTPASTRGREILLTRL